MSQYQGILFDLDGTLLDTAPDMGAAANVALRQFGYPELTPAIASQVSSHGVNGLLGAVMGANLARTDILPMRHHLLDAYRQALSVETRLFHRVEDLISGLDGAGIPWGIITNKPGWLTEPLLDLWPSLDRARCRIAGDTFEHPKPHPKPMMAGAEAIGLDPNQILYVGDAERDMQAAQAAGMAGAVALWGYLRPEDQPQAWGGDHLCQCPSELMPLMGL
ncbi:HAD family hydrolase [Ferrimonas marina]|uniref:Phosphoglycolate phosphatase n=1 Tax=Ferrimonas marina TaxID=299255 RepID=A0A1M5NBH4_9GAMM|nr:HAD-IA family hydrolase [Ferrimonas marina]SHG86343.1 phosphoglycolate phosphatase [Ferrimonas marina]